MKKAGNYRSLIRGVSEQAPELRPEGQLTEQVNMVPDPVQGLSRRFGSVFQAQKNLSITPSTPNIALIQADTANWRTFDYFSQGIDYTICLRRAAKPSGSPLPVMLVYNRTTKTFLTLHRPVTDTTLDLLESGGASAITNVGKYVFMAGNTIVPTSTSTDLWGDNANLARSLIWIRGGAYARTYSATVTKLDGTKVSFSYKTPAASYPVPLDVSGVPQFSVDPTGGSTASVPTTAQAVEDASSALLSGFTYPLVHGASTPTNISLSGTAILVGVGGDSGFDLPYQTYATYGVDFTVSGGVLTMSPSFRSSGGQVFTSYQVVYSYLPGGTTVAPVYTFVPANEPLYLKNYNGYARGNLTYKDFAPKNLIVYQGTTVLTNSYPTLPVAGQFYWAGEDKELVFPVELAGTTTVSVQYDHYKTVLNDNYAKQISDVTNAYSGAVTKWIADSAAAISPSAIALKLTEAAVAAGLTTATTQGPNTIFDNVKSISVDDGGDGSLMRGVADEVSSVDGVSTTHFVGKIVRVRGKNSKESFYLVATAKDKTVTTGYTEVIWVEGVGTRFTVNAGLIYGTAIGTDFYIASSASALQTLAGISDVPDYDASTAGDADTNALPYFVGRKITMLAVFQDRLLLGSGGVIRTSKTGEYLNFFRSTVLTLPADDAMEFLSQGSADDELRYSLLYDQNLVIFGLKKQYIINGKQPLTPTNANMVPMSNHADASELPPLAAAGFIFYGKKGPSSSSVHQIQPSLAGSNSPDSFIISSQIDLYLKGDAIELVQLAKPSTLFLRTAGSRNSIYCFSYLDVQDGRKQDAWHRWDYDANLGVVVGIQPTSEGLLIFSVRNGTKAAGGTATWAVADMQVLTTGLSKTPYLDSQRPYADALADTTGWSNPANAWLYSAFGDETEFFLLGGRAADSEDLQDTYPDATGLWVGAQYTASVSPTNPYARDDSGKALIEGRLTVGKFAVQFSRTSGYWYDITYNRESTSFKFNGRIFGDPNNLIGREPISSYTRHLTVGRETREFDLTIRSRDWMPLTITTMSWSGQYFNRTQQG